MKKYKIIYTFNHPKMGFQNSITVIAQSVDEAIERARCAVRETYREMSNKFSFKPDPTMNGVIF